MLKAEDAKRMTDVRLKNIPYMFESYWRQNEDTYSSIIEENISAGYYYALLHVCENINILGGFIDEYVSFCIEKFKSYGYDCEKTDDVGWSQWDRIIVRWEEKDIA